MVYQPGRMSSWGKYMERYQSEQASKVGSLSVFMTATARGKSVLCKCRCRQLPALANNG